MKIRGTLLKPLDDQLDPAPHVDPAGLTWENPVVLTADFDHAHPLGTGTVERMPDGSIEFEAEIDDSYRKSIQSGELGKVAKLAVGVIVDRHLRTPDVRVISDARIFCVGLTARHADPEQPGIRIVKR